MNTAGLPSESMPVGLHPKHNPLPSLSKPAKFSFDSRFTYKNKFVETCENLFEYGLSHYEKREAEVALFSECMREALLDNQEQGAKILEAFETKNSGVRGAHFLGRFHPAWGHDKESPLCRCLVTRRAGQAKWLWWLVGWAVLL